MRLRKAQCQRQSLVLTRSFSGSDRQYVKLIDTSTAVGKRDYAFHANTLGDKTRTLISNTM
ncbi:hypothetical protein NIES4073_12820 [Kalymmatonema gypsitolerans NIES-4073]|nr:hypothetical protein NIES4073_12820 [Scytonema sp. NIES-4073]